MKVIVCLCGYMIALTGTMLEMKPYGDPTIMCPYCRRKLH